jgi:uncharacterized membrane protein (UPF0136 family)
MTMPRISPEHAADLICAVVAFAISLAVAQAATWGIFFAIHIVTGDPIPSAMMVTIVGGFAGWLVYSAWREVAKG